LLESSVGKDVVLELDLDPHIPPIAANSTQVQQAILNLCLNSRDAMPNGGKISISTAEVDLDGDLAPAYQDIAAKPGKYIRIRVADDGSGIAEENLDKIFDPFFTTKEVGKGSGLGLAMVYGIVQNARGYVQVRSEEKKGTEFNLYFRLASGKEQEPALSQLKPGLEGNETILLVDDEPMVRDLGTEILRGYGYQVIEASDGVEALEIFKHKRAEIDLVILDLLMPKLSGKETLERLRQLDSTLKILICSGYGSRELGSKLLDGDRQTPLVHKPFKPEELVYAVRKMLDIGGDTDSDSSGRSKGTRKVIALRR
jgi:CheY-like chemotaxis protein